MATSLHHSGKPSVMEAVLAHRQSASDQYHHQQQQRSGNSHRRAGVSGAGHQPNTNDDAVAEAHLLRDQVVADNSSKLKMQEDLRFLRHQLDARETKIVKLSGEFESLKGRNEQLKKMLSEKDEVNYCLKMDIAQMKNDHDRLMEENINLTKNLHLLEQDLGIGAAGGNSSFNDSFNQSNTSICGGGNNNTHNPMPSLAGSFKSNSSLRRQSSFTTTSGATTAAPQKDRFTEMMKDKTTIVTLRRKLREGRAVQMEVRRRSEMCMMEAEDQISAFAGELSEFLHEEGCLTTSTTTTTVGGDGSATDGKEEEVEGEGGVGGPGYYNYAEGPMGRYIPLIRRIYMEGREDDEESNNGDNDDKKNKRPKTNGEAKRSAAAASSGEGGGGPKLISFKNVKALGHHLEGSLFKEFKMALNLKFADEDHLQRSFQYSPFGQPLASINMELSRLVKDSKEHSELQVNSLFYIFDEMERRLAVTDKALAAATANSSNHNGGMAGGGGVSIAGALGQLRRGSGGGGISASSTLLRRDGSLANPRADFVEEMKAHVNEFNKTLRRILVCVREGAKRVIGLEGTARNEWLRQYHAQLQMKEIGTQMNAEEIPDPKIGKLEERVEYLNNRMATITTEHSSSLLEFQLQRDKAEVVTKFLQEKLFALHDGVYECLHSVFNHRVQWISTLPNSFASSYADIKRLGNNNIESPLFTSVQFNTDVGNAVEEDSKLLRQFAHFFVAGDSYSALGPASPTRTNNNQQRPNSALAGSPLGTRKVNQRNNNTNNFHNVKQHQQPQFHDDGENATPLSGFTAVAFPDKSNRNRSSSSSGRQSSSFAHTNSAGTNPPLANSSFGSQSSLLDNSMTTSSDQQQQQHVVIATPIITTVAKGKSKENQQQQQQVKQQQQRSAKMTMAKNNNNVPSSFTGGTTDPQEFSRKRKKKFILSKAEKQQKQLADTMKKLLVAEQKRGGLDSSIGGSNGVGVGGPSSSEIASPLIFVDRSRNSKSVPPAALSFEEAEQKNRNVTSTQQPAAAAPLLPPATVKASSALSSPSTIIVKDENKPAAVVPPPQSTAATTEPPPVTTTLSTSLPDIRSLRGSLSQTLAGPPSPTCPSSEPEAGRHFSRNSSLSRTSSFCSRSAVVEPSSSSTQQQQAFFPAATTTSTVVNTDEREAEREGEREHHHHDCVDSSPLLGRTQTPSSSSTLQLTTTCSTDVVKINDVETAASNAAADFGGIRMVTSVPSSRSPSIDGSNCLTRKMVSSSTASPPTGETTTAPSQQEAAGTTTSSTSRRSSHPTPLLLDSITEGLTRKVGGSSSSSALKSSSSSSAPRPSHQQSPRIPSTGTQQKTKVSPSRSDGAVSSPARRNSASAAIGGTSASSSRRGSLTGPTPTTSTPAGRTTTAAFAPPVGVSRLALNNASFTSATTDSGKSTPRGDGGAVPPTSSTTTTRRRASTVTIACEYERMASWQRRQQELWQIKREENAKDIKRSFENTIVTSPQPPSEQEASSGNTLPSHHHHPMPTPPQTPNSSSNVLRSNNNSSSGRPSTTGISAMGSRPFGRVGSSGENGGALSRTASSTAAVITPRTFNGPF